MSLSNNPAPTGILFSIDVEPSANLNQIQGWAFSGTSTIQLELMLDGESILSWVPQFPRIDVYRNFANTAASLVSGFKFYFPKQGLADIPPGALSLWAVGENGEKKQIWSWVQGQQSELTGSAKDALLQLAAEHRQEASFGKSPESLHVAIETTGRLPYLRAAFRKILQFAEQQREQNLTFHSITIFYPPENFGAEEEIRELLKDERVPQDISLKTQQRPRDWTEFSGDDRDLLLFISEDAVLDFVNFSTMIEHFCELPSISVLMPTPYGNGLAAKNSLELGELNQYSVLGGENIPALVPVDTVGPIWLSSLQSLRHNSSFLPQSSNISKFHYDLRQAVAVRESDQSNVDAGTMGIMQSVLDNEIEWLAPANTETIAIVVPETVSDLGSDHRYQVLELANNFRNSGKRVVFVSNGENAGYLEGIRLYAFSEFAAQPEGLSWAIATSWDTVQETNLFRYLFGCKVGRFIQHLEHQQYRDRGFEKLENAKRSYRAEFVPIVTSKETFAALSPQDIETDDFVHFNPSYNKQLFFPMGNAERKQQILCDLDACPALNPSEIEELRAAFERVRDELPNTKIVLSGYRKHYETLLPVVTEQYSSLGSADRFRLYSESVSVIFWGNPIGGSPRTLEAMACGAIPMVSTKEHCGDFGSVGENMVIATNLPADLAEILANRDYAQQLQTEALKTALNQNENVNRSVLDEIETCWTSIVAQLSQRRTKRRAMSLIVPVYCALDATIQCLRSIFANADDFDELIIVNDASDRGTTEWLRNFSAQRNDVKFVDFEKNRGFVQACTAGVEVAKPENDIVLVNSDIVLTNEALRLLQDGAYSRYNVGLASALSTNSPHLEISVNPGDSLEIAAQRIRSLHTPEYPTIITPEGQLLYIRR